MYLLTQNCFHMLLGGVPKQSPIKNTGLGQQMIDFEGGFINKAKIANKTLNLTARTSAALTVKYLGAAG
jgi:hypothetical protein